MRGVVRGDQLAGARQMKIEQAREPKAQRSSAQHQRPVRVLGSGKGPHPMIGIEEHPRIAVDQRAGAGPVMLDAPVVDAHRDIEQQAVAPGEVKVDEATEAAFSGGVLEQHVVAKQISVNRAARQLIIAVSELVVHFVLQQRSGDNKAKKIFFS